MRISLKQLRNPAAELQHGGGDDDPAERHRQEHLPAQPHQLVVAVAGQRSLGPAEDEQQEHDLEAEPHEARHPGEGRVRDRRHPAAQEQDGAHRRQQDHVGVFAEEEQREGHRRIFGLEALDELGFRHRQVERRAVGLGQRRHEEDHEHRQQRQPEPFEEPARTRAITTWVRLSEPTHEQHRDQHEADRNFVGHHLRRRAQHAQEGIFRVRRPAGDDDAVNAERGNGEEVEDADIDVGDDQPSSKGIDSPGDQAPS